MSFFNKILEKLGLRKPEPAVSGTASAGHPNPAATARAHTPAISEVDVVKLLEQRAAGKKGLDWKVSIVDLLKLLDIDSSFEARKELAVELGCPAALMGDSAKMNTWLHKEVLKRIAENGGNIPQNMLD
ncbi:MAG TPA: DUF3597 domain-containing protein [Anaerolineales bacterium]|nr:DUF3597 domain-containing protein [Anaerolineales bacterium]